MNGRNQLWMREHLNNLVKGRKTFDKDRWVITVWIWPKQKSFWVKHNPFGSKPNSFGAKPNSFRSKPNSFGAKQKSFGSKPKSFGSKKRHLRPKINLLAEQCGYYAVQLDGLLAKWMGY